MDEAARSVLWVREGLRVESSRSVLITNRYFALDTYHGCKEKTSCILDVSKCI